MGAESEAESEAQSGARSEDSVWPGVSLSMGLQVFTFFCPQSLTDSVTSCLDVFILVFVDVRVMAQQQRLHLNVTGFQ